MDDKGRERVRARMAHVPVGTKVRVAVGRDGTRTVIQATYQGEIHLTDLIPVFSTNDIAPGLVECVYGVKEEK